MELTSGWGSECAHPTRGLPEDPECTSTSFGDLQPMLLGGEFGSLQVRFCRLNLALSPALQNSFMCTNLLFTTARNLPGGFRIMKTLDAFAQKKCKKYIYIFSTCYLTALIKPVTVLRPLSNILFIPPPAQNIFFQAVYLQLH